MLTTHLASATWIGPCLVHNAEEVEGTTIGTAATATTAAETT